MITTKIVFDRKKVAGRNGVGSLEVRMLGNSPFDVLFAPHGCANSVVGLSPAVSLPFVLLKVQYVGWLSAK